MIVNNCKTSGANRVDPQLAVENMRIEVPLAVLMCKNGEVDDIMRVGFHRLLKGR